VAVAGGEVTGLGRGMAGGRDGAGDGRGQRSMWVGGGSGMQAVKVACMQEGGWWRRAGLRCERK
jgi:hypothetical protein